MNKYYQWILSLILICGFAFCFNMGIELGDHAVLAGADDDHASDFTLKDSNGNTVRFRDYKGRTALLYFMTTWCPECREAIPHLKDIHARYSGKGLVFYGVSVLEDKEKVVAYAKKRGLSYPILLDDDGKVAKEYGVVGVPVMVLINGEGRIICWNCRSIDKLLEKQFK
jgi:peroxiredoxin